MRHIIKTLDTLGSELNFSPEFWLADQSASQLSSGILFKELVSLVSQTTTPPLNSKFILDTGSARSGLLELPILGNEVSDRTSAKKVVAEGDLLISRLRPYLMQVMYIPLGTFELLDVEHLYCSTEFFIFRSKNKGCLSGLSAWLLSTPIQSMIQEAATGGHHPRFSADLLLNAPVDESYLESAFCKKLNSLFLGHIKSQRQFSVLLRHSPRIRVAA